MKWVIRYCTETQAEQLKNIIEDVGFCDTIKAIALMASYRGSEVLIEQQDKVKSRSLESMYKDLSKIAHQYRTLEPK